MLVTLSGPPAAGKTTLARALAAATGAVPLRIDLVEQAVVTAGLEQHPVGPVGYAVAYALAEDLLRQGFAVVADAVNPLQEIRDTWRRVADAAGVPVVEVEVVCSDRQAHRERAEGRAIDIPDLPRVTWERIEALELEPWARPVLRVDSAVTGTDEAVAQVRSAMERAAAGWTPGAGSRARRG